MTAHSKRSKKCKAMFNNPATNSKINDSNKIKSKTLKSKKTIEESKDISTKRKSRKIKSKLNEINYSKIDNMIYF